MGGGPPLACYQRFSRPREHLLLPPRRRVRSSAYFQEEGGPEKRGVHAASVGAGLRLAVLRAGALGCTACPRTPGLRTWPVIPATTDMCFLEFWRLTSEAG